MQVRERGSPRTAANPKTMGGRRGKGGKRRGASALGFSGVSEGLTLDEYVGAASTEHHVSTPGPQSPLKSPLRAAPSPPKRRSPLKPRSALLPPLSKGERRPKSNKSVRFTPGTAGSVLSSDDEPEDVPDPSKIWAMPPPRKFDYEWRFNAPAKVLVHGVDINARPGPVAEAPPAAELSMMNPVVAPNQVSLAEMRRRRRVERTRRTLRTPWLPSHGHVRRAPYAPNGTYLFPTPSSNLLSKKVRTRFVSRVLCFSFARDVRHAPRTSARRWRAPPVVTALRRVNALDTRRRREKLKKELITLESDLVGGPEVSTMAESEQHGRVLGDMLDLRKELMRTIASPWHPRMGRRR